MYEAQPTSTAVATASRLSQDLVDVDRHQLASQTDRRLPLYARVHAHTNERSKHVRTRAQMHTNVSHIYRHTQTDRCTDGQTDEWTHERTHKQTAGNTER